MLDCERYVSWSIEIKPQARLGGSIGGSVVEDRESSQGEPTIT